jgi:O-Antigen ligase
MAYVAVLLAGVAMVAVLRAIFRRPQRGLLVAAALLPFQGLLLIVPQGESFVWWKELLLAATLVAAFLAPQRQRGGVSLPWLPIAVILGAIGAVSALVTVGFPGAIYPLKITFFYMVVVPLICWYTPLTARDRDNLVTIMMTVSVVTAVWGIVQQFLGAAVLHDMGYEYNTALRTSGSFMRSFSTFVQPFPFGLYVMMVVLVGGAVALQNPGRLRNRLFLLTIPIQLAGMGMSIVRAAYLGVIVGVLWLAIHRYRHLFVAVGLAAVAGAISLFYIPTKYVSSLFSSSSLGQRTSGWSQIGESVMTNPFGQGLGATGSAAEKLETATRNMPREYLSVLQNLNPALAYQPDNYYVKMLLELGPIGLWAFGTLLVVVLVSALRASRYTQGVDSAFCLGVSAAIVAACAASVVSTYFEIFPLDFYFWLLVSAVGCAVVQRPDGAEVWDSEATGATARSEVMVR